MTSIHHSSDLLIVGGGFVGLTLAISLVHQGFSVTVIEQQNLAAITSKNSDGRASAIAHASKDVLERYGIWEEFAPFAGPIEEIRVTDGDSLLHLHFDRKQIGEEPLGFMLENHTMLATLYRRACTLSPRLTLCDAVKIKNILREDAYTACILEDGREMRGSLLVAADGKHSKVREQAGIHVHGWDYGQTAIVCNVRHKEHHSFIAQERFLPAGPFAILPLKDGYHSSIVWTEKRHLAPTFMAMEDDAFMYHLAERFGDYLGELALAGPRFSYPLSVSWSAVPGAKRLVLIGDAAHAIHPIAGQGLNLGILDIGVLVKVLNACRQLGQDLGSSRVLSAYAEERMGDNVLMALITDGLNRLFSNDNRPLRMARRLGLAAVNQLPSLQRFFMRYAMGVNR